MLYFLAKRWPSPVANRIKRFNAEPGTQAYKVAYAEQQFNSMAVGGASVSVLGKEVLEIGCGHGGISCFLACAGASRVVSIDINKEILDFARYFASNFANRFGLEQCKIIEFLEMPASQLIFENETFDLVYADNVFEHFTDPEAVMKEAYRILRPGGILVVPRFSSIYSKYGLHLKHGLKLPWANLFFSEKVIVQTMQHLAKDNPQLVVIYPGLAQNPQSVRDLRKHSDLNDMTYSKFKEMAKSTGFKIERFEPITISLGKVICRIPFLRNSRLIDIFSIGASSTLRK